MDMLIVLDDAKTAVNISKYPPQGIRSMTGQLPQLGMKSTPVDDVASLMNSSASTVIAMIESGHAVEHAGEIAAVDGIDIVLIGSSDLSIDLGVGNQFDSPKYRSAIEKVSQACTAHGKIFGLAGVYDKPEVQDWAINTLGARFMLVQQDISLISAGAPRAASAVPEVKS
jgi:2-keto-3-deoxy-L-rhamnonate aldolase RhmA